MRLSQAILLGSTGLTPSYRSFGDGKTTGCALRMAANAMGKPLTISEECGTERVLEHCSPWLYETPVELPCGCTIRHQMAYNAIIHLFDYHINPEQRGDWTIEQLADYVRSIEPADEEMQKPGPVLESIHEESAIG